MTHLFRGKPIMDAALPQALRDLGPQILRDMASGHMSEFSPQWVYDAVDALVLSGQAAALLLGAPGSAVAAASAYLSGAQLAQRIERELGQGFLQWQPVAVAGSALQAGSAFHEGGHGVIEERLQALGVLLHVGAGNAVALSALSVLEGLLCGNINVLKVPSHEGGLSIMLLEALVAVEPRLEPFVYAFDVSSTDEAALKQLASACDAAVVWGSDAAIEGIRRLAPATLSLIEWGHRLSFAYITEKAAIEPSMAALAKEIHETNQLFCHSPQCLFVETTSRVFLMDCATALFEAMKAESSPFHNAAPIDIHQQAEVTWVKAMVRMEAALGNQAILEDEHTDFAVLVDLSPLSMGESINQRLPTLKSSPLYKTIWLVPVQRTQLFEILRPHKGHLQTAGVACGPGEYSEITDCLFTAGVHRIKAMGEMGSTYLGEPHDGKQTLVHYTRRVNRYVR